jgi:hypothetical protein
MNGHNGLKLPLNVKQMKAREDFTVQFWMRSAKSLKQRASDASGTFAMPEVLVNIPGVLFCYIQIADFICEVGPVTGPSVALVLSDEGLGKVGHALPDTRQWAHFTFSSDVDCKKGNSYIRIDYLSNEKPYFSREVKCKKLAQKVLWKQEQKYAFLGLSGYQRDKSIPRSLTAGFVGDLREFVVLKGHRTRTVRLDSFHVT